MIWKPFEIRKTQTRDTKGKFVSEEPLVQVTVSNPIAKFQNWVSKLISNEGVDLKIRIHPLTAMLVAGIIAAVGTGIDTEIIITDELLRGEKGDEAASLLTRVKRALFIVFAAASVSLATMLPIIFFGFGLGKLVGFAITTSMGVLVGVLITRPAFAEMARWALEKKPSD